MNIKEKESFIKDFLTKEKEKLSIITWEKDLEELSVIFNKHYLPAIFLMMVSLFTVVVLYTALNISIIILVVIFVLLALYPAFVILTYVCCKQYKIEIKKAIEKLENNKYGNFKHTDITTILESNKKDEQEYNLKIDGIYNTLKSIS